MRGLLATVPFASVVGRPPVLNKSVHEVSAILHTPDVCTFCQSPIQWQIAKPDAHTAAVDAILHAGPDITVDTHHAPLCLAFGLEVSRTTEPVTNLRPNATVSSHDAVSWTWRNLSLRSPTLPLQFLW